SQGKRVLELSIEEARQLGHTYIGPEHLLLGLIKEGQSIAAKILESLGARLNEVRQGILELLSAQDHRRTVTVDDFTPQAQRVLELSLEAARRLGHDHAGPEHLLLALSKEGPSISDRLTIPQ